MTYNFKEQRIFSNLLTITPHFFLPIITIEVKALCPVIFKDQKSVLIKMFIQQPLDCCLDGIAGPKVASTQFFFLKFWKKK